MKNLKVLIAVAMAVLFMMTSCTEEESTTQAILQDGNMIEETATHDQFLKINEEMEAQGYEPVTVTENLITEMEDRNGFCPPCYPWLSDISTYNLGGNNRGFGVSGGRHHPCSYQLFWGPDSGVTLNWQNGGFASMTFPGPGTYKVWVNLKSKEPGGVSCIVGNYTTVIID